MSQMKSPVKVKGAGGLGGNGGGGFRLQINVGSNAVETAQKFKQYD